MTRASIYVVITGLILLLTILPASADTIVVGDSNGDFSDIQAAVDSAKPGDIIDIMPGSYYGSVTIDFPLAIRGSGPDTVVGSEEEDFCFFISSDGVKVTDLKCNGKTNGILINGSDDTVVRDCIFEGSRTAITIYKGTGCRIEDCDVVAGYTGIEVEGSNYTTLSKNLITAPARGISVKSSENMLVTGNHLDKCEVGIAAEGLSESNIERNNLSDMTGGIVFIASGNCNVGGNDLAGVTQYLQFFTSQGCIVNAELDGAEYFTADIFSDTLYRFANYSVTGHDFALVPLKDTRPDVSGYRQFGDAFNLTFINVSQVTYGYVMLDASYPVDELEGYDAKTYGVYRIDGRAEMVSQPVIDNGTVTTVALIEGPGTGHYALMVKEKTEMTRISILILLILVLGVLGAVYRQGKR
ncbi:MAG: right-handed parallel beta-helix repeat-containing protein [Methanosarcinaceae archaeon]|nr:right-handed parallel beta-helix repeat-containing protein [Methanosarcinaceae archaeon]